MDSVDGVKNPSLRRGGFRVVHKGNVEVIERVQVASTCATRFRTN